MEFKGKAWLNVHCWWFGPLFLCGELALAFSRTRNGGIEGVIHAKASSKENSKEKGRTVRGDDPRRYAPEADTNNYWGMF